MKHWWAGVLLLACAIALHALVPRYEWHSLTQGIYVRVDRWTGDAAWGQFDSVGAEREGHWVAAWDLGLRQRWAKLAASPPPKTDDELFAQLDAALGPSPHQPSFAGRFHDWWGDYSILLFLLVVPVAWTIGAMQGRRHRTTFVMAPPLSPEDEEE